MHRTTGILRRRDSAVDKAKVTARPPTSTNRPRDRPAGRPLGTIILFGRGLEIFEGTVRNRARAHTASKIDADRLAPASVDPLKIARPTDAAGEGIRDAPVRRGDRLTRFHVEGAIAMRHVIIAACPHPQRHANRERQRERGVQKRRQACS